MSYQQQNMISQQTAPLIISHDDNYEDNDDAPTMITCNHNTPVNLLLPPRCTGRCTHEIHQLVPMLSKAHTLTIFNFFMVFNFDAAVIYYISSSPA